MREQDIDDDERDDFDDDWCDDDCHPVKEEPDCFACNDGGCRECQPTRLAVWWWNTVGWRLAELRMRRRARRLPGPVNDEPPF
ncbi:hypothetical protein [Alloactinosynnema sp. L-07]|uniref:hypothetical protein n=1 Tax=Alloactinosynnema sp. L-07 TaxID=1653480 RepID=UPI00065F0039|nr:hypothetical protein [Alloactinosynnema sp. L-07]CRK59031.1 hypothetical protein [Alloactinosynnema sp. L-07]